jgi:hypothetical protein
MIRQSIRKNLVTGLSAVFCAVFVSSAVAQSEFTTYALEKNGCKAARASGFIITWESSSSVTGPGFTCALGGLASVGTGLAGYNSTCTIGIQDFQGLVVFGMATRPNQEHFTITLPNDGSASMYPCTEVDGLTGTN